MMPEMLIAVRACRGGVIISVTLEGETDEWPVQERDDERQEIENWCDVLAAIYDEYGVPGGRYAAARLYFTVAPGDKHPEFKDELFQ